ncbi:MAG TPA: adenylate/guanylate cyclase domain-containing protein [Acidimicrobiales bacterium]|nr:adenylate/guanylate cyclase domain-containing protein [Acidimicrobiales bacterium]
MVPSGTVTLMFTDIEGSTRMWEEHPEAMWPALELHDALWRATIEEHGGYVFKTVGDAFCAAFSSADEAVAAAAEGQRRLWAAAWPEPLSIRVRIGLHTGTCEERDGDYFGPTVNRAARLEATAHGGQTVVSAAVVGALGALPAGASLSDLGEHRLKDLGRPERVYQVDVEGLVVDFPPLRSLDNPQLRNNLPVQVSTFVGRQRELAEIRELLERTRLLTLAGAGGAGKSRLAVQVAADLLDGSGDGVWWVELASLPDPGLVAAAVAEAVSVREEPGRPVLDSLLDALGDRDLLLVLDNCEHLIGECATVAEAILRRCPQVEIITTSREPLGITGERVWRVPSLGFPPEGEGTRAAEVAGYEAVRLFVERATAHQPAFVLDDVNAAAVASICRRLDGMPLALELAAARLRSLSAAEVDRRLDDRFRLLSGGSRTALPRQRTLRALVDWSYELLTETERTVLCALSVFAGGWSMDQAEPVCAGGDVDRDEVVDLVTSLVDKSLVQADTTGETARYRLLETVRQYAAGLLAQSGGAPDTRRRHAAAFLALVDEAAPELAGPAQATWLGRLDTEHDNLRAAFDHLGDEEGGALGQLRLGVGLRWFFRTRGFLAEGTAWLDAALDRPDAPGPGALVAEALTVCGYLHSRQGDLAGGRSRLAEALAMARGLGDPARAADALCEMAWVAQRQGDYEEAERDATEAMTLAAAAGDPHLAARAAEARAAASPERGADEARADYLVALEGYRTVGDRQRMGVTRNNLGVLELDQGRYDAAVEHFTAALEIVVELGDVFVLPYLLYGIGLATALQGDEAAGRRSFLEALELSRRNGDLPMAAYCVLGLALCRDDRRAATLHGEATALFEACGETVEPLEAALAEWERARLRAALGAGFDDAFGAGRRAGVPAAMEDALGDAAEG